MNRYLSRFPGGILVSVCLFVLVTAGCSAPEPTRPSAKDFVTYTNVDGLEERSSEDGVFVYMGPNVRLADYTKVIVDPCLVGLRPEGDHWVGGERAASLARLLRRELTASLSKHYEVVDRPEEAAMRVASGIVDQKKRNPAPGESAWQACFGLILRDARTGQRIGVAYDFAHGRELEALIRGEDWPAVEKAVTDWAALVADRLKGTESDSSTATP